MEVLIFGRVGTRHNIFGQFLGNRTSWIGTLNSARSLSRVFWHFCQISLVFIIHWNQRCLFLFWVFFTFVISFDPHTLLVSIRLSDRLEVLALSLLLFYLEVETCLLTFFLFLLLLFLRVVIWVRKVLVQKVELFFLDFCLSLVFHFNDQLWKTALQLLICLHQKLVFFATVLLTAKLLVLKLPIDFVWDFLFALIIALFEDATVFLRHVRGALPESHLSR